MKKLLFPTLLVAGLTAFQPAALACRSCMGGEAMALTPAIDSAILLLIGILTVIAAAFLKFIFFLAKCDRQSLTPETEQS